MDSGTKARELTALAQSVVEPRETAPGVAVPRLDPMTLWAANSYDELTPWGARPKKRDAELRAFWPTENWLETTIGLVAERNQAMSWKITGDEATAEAVQQMLQNANFGGGWEEFIGQTTIDLLTQDSGAFVELIRTAASEFAPVIGIAHLDAGRCWGTGVPETPILYETIDKKFRLMPWYSVVQLLEMPDPRVFTNTGFFFKLQHCMVSRVVRAASILRNIAIYKDEKTGGRYTRGVHLIAGFAQDELESAMAKAGNQDDAAGLMRYSSLPIISAINPEQKIDHVLLEMAGLPDNFDEEVTIKNYITLLANSAGIDYQDIAPLPGGNLGTGAQSEVLERKSRGRGVALFQKLITRLMNHAGALPHNVQFEFDEVNLDEELNEAEVVKARGEDLIQRVAGGILLPIEARKIAVEQGDLPLEMFEEYESEFDPELLRQRAEAEKVAQAAQLQQLNEGESGSGGSGSAPDESVEEGEQASSPDDEASVREGQRARGVSERAGPDDDRLEFEDESALQIQRGFAEARKLMNSRLREHAAAS